MEIPRSRTNRGTPSPSRTGSVPVVITTDGTDGDGLIGLPPDARGSACRAIEGGHHVVPPLVELDEHVSQHPDDGQRQGDTQYHDRVGADPEVLVDDVVHELARPDEPEERGGRAEHP